MSFDADFVSIDVRQSRNTFKNVRIIDEPLTITADEGQSSEQNAGNEEWRLSGNVRITMDSAEILADSAVLKVAAKRVVSGELIGDPAAFDLLIEERDTRVRGTAGRIQYDHVERVARMLDGALLVVGDQEIACNWTYDFDSGTVEGFSDNDAPCRAIINPR